MKNEENDEEGVNIGRKFENETGNLWKVQLTDPGCQGLTTENKQNFHNEHCRMFEE